jgi:hypothetical protein
MASAAPHATSHPPFPTSIVASLGRYEPPFEIDRFGASFGIRPARPSGILNFRFCFQEVPFHARTERREGRPVLSFTGDLGILPFTIENATRRRRLRKVLAAARHASGLCWTIGADHCIRVTGEIDLGMKLTPTAVIAGATTLLLKSRPYLDLIIAVASES